ncbi:MAG: hypothetical protein U5K33_04080 [Halofilum sp. (in: g-proteobacteria)]|nr:hypothetical protein [Halofilum sp. (in: g-proteobacteria)]
MSLRAFGDEPAESDDSPLASWHANLIYIDRRKCVLFTNDRTLFNFVAPDVSRAEIRKLGTLFLFYLSCALNEAGLAEHLVTRIVDECFKRYVWEHMQPQRTWLHE